MVKKIVSILCVLSFTIGIFGNLSVCADENSIVLTDPIDTQFVASDWTGNTDKITSSGDLSVSGSSESKLTSVNKYNLSEGFLFSTTLKMYTGYNNYYNESCYVSVGGLKLMIRNKNNANEYSAALYYDTTLLGTADLSSPNHVYALAFADGVVKAMIDNAVVSWTDSQGETADEFSAAGFSFADSRLVYSLRGNWSPSGARYFRGIRLRSGADCVYRPKTVYLHNISTTGPENEYFAVPDQTVIYTGDTIKPVYSNYTQFTWPNESQSEMWNVTSVRGNWSKSVQPQNGGTFTFSTAGTYTLYNTSNGYGLITFTVTDNFYGINLTDDPTPNPDTAYPVGSVSNTVNIPTGDDAELLETSLSGVYFTSDIWQAVPMVSQAILDAGYEGGEGCQAMINMVCDPITGELCFMGTDVGGLYKSTDGGDHWTISTIGLNSAGATGFAIDPNNINRVLCVGTNSGAHSANGIYLSTDAGNTWQMRFDGRTIGYRDFRTQIAFDATSYNAEIGGSAVAYYSREKDVTSATSNPAVYKTTDGGLTWTELAGTTELAGGYIFVHSQNGYVFCGNSNGFYRSADGGATFTKLLNIPIISMDSVRTYPDSIYATTTDGLYISNDCGVTWTRLRGNNYPLFNPDHLKVSPVDPSYMILQDDKSVAGQYTHVTYYSHDGGKNWFVSDHNNTGQWVPETSARQCFAWSPVYKKSVLGMWSGIYKSIDGGANFTWSNAGYNGICGGGKINWNVNHPEMMLFGSQDYNAAYTLNNGATWNYLNASGSSWGGYVYGGYILDANKMFCGVATGWTAPRVLRVSLDGGTTWSNAVNADAAEGEDSTCVISGTEIGMGALGSDSIAFLGEWRTTDGGLKWRKMNYDSVTGSMGCDGVFTVDYNTGRLFGAKGNRIVTSSNNGETWRQIGVADAFPSDMAFNSVTGELFVTAAGYAKYSQVDFSEPNNAFSTVNHGKSGSVSVCIDKNNPQIIYIGCASNTNFGVSNILRSIDYGRTWTALRREKNDGRTGPDGARQPMSLRVNSNTSELFVMTGCRGFWKLAPAPDWYLDINNTVPVSVIEQQPEQPQVISSDIINELRTIRAEHDNSSLYESKTVVLPLVSAAGGEYNYFGVPENTVIYTGDKIKLGYSAGSTVFTWPDGTTGTSWNITSIRGSWSHSKQCGYGSSGEFIFSEPGYYTLWSMDKSVALVTFEVVDRFGGITPIYTKADLDNIRGNLSGNYVLMNDIGFKVSDFAASGAYYNSGALWQPIGTAEAPFTGIFYANGHKISGIKVNASAASDAYGGLFGYSCGYITGLTMSDCRVTVESSSGSSYAGAVCGMNAGVVNECTATAILSADNTGICGTTSADGTASDNIFGTAKIVHLTLNSFSANENEYFSVPEGVTIYTGDAVKPSYSAYTSFTWPDGSSSTMWNITYVKGNWSYSKQCSNEKSDYFTFDTAGTYTLYNTDKGIALITFTVVDRFA